MSREVTSRRLRKSSDSPAAAGTLNSDAPAVTSFRLHAICVVQALLAAAVFTVTEHDDHHQSFWCAVEMTLQSVLVIAATFFIRTRVERVARSAAILPMLVMVVCLSLVCEPIQRVLLGEGHSFEMLIMHSQCNLMMALAACGFRMSYQRLSVLIAVFTTIFCCTMSSAHGLIPLVAAYALSAIAWLIAAWWENVDRRVLNETRRGLPKLQLAATAIIPVLMLLGATGAGADKTTSALEGFLPGSGGTGEHDPFSRGGVNDGDALVAGNKNIKSFAALEDAPFLDSDKPSLYDVFNDTFDDPATPIKKHERAISLTAELMQHLHREISDAKQAGREFSLIRGQREAGKDRARDLNAHALFHVAGRTPVHFRMEVYDLFDGVSWLSGERALPAEGPRMRTVEDRFWLSIPVAGAGYDFFGTTETHSIKTSGLDGNVIPTPAHLAGVNIPHVDRLNMYHVSADGIVSMDRESVPSMTPINMVSHSVDRRAISHSVLVTPRWENNVLSVLPEGEDMDRVRGLAERLIAGKPRGWEQVVAIEEYLRDNMTLDREARLAPETVSPVEEFLFQTRRGPEYLFAGSAAVMLRSVGYPARVVSGFYAGPDKYDTHRRHTPVHAEDAHLWCEVCIGASTWLTVEASPGYELLAPPATFWERVAASLRALWQAAVRNVGVLSLIGMLLVLALLKRRFLENAFRTLEWHLAATRGRRTRATLLARLIDHRLRLAGLPRRSGTTLKRWASQPPLSPVRDSLCRIADLADQAAYDTGDSEIAVEPGELNRLASQLSLQELRRLKQSTTQMAG